MGFYKSKNPNLVMQIPLIGREVRMHPNGTRGDAFHGNAGCFQQVSKTDIASQNTPRPCPCPCHDPDPDPDPAQLPMSCCSWYTTRSGSRHGAAPFLGHVADEVGKGAGSIKSYATNHPFSNVLALFRAIFSVEITQV